MKKRLSLILLLITVLLLAACSSQKNENVPKHLSQEGIAPYELTEREKYLLQALGIGDNSQIISFHAPQEAICLNVNVYQLEAGGNWSNIGGGAISIGTEREPTDQLTGTFTMQLKEDYAIDFSITSNGRAAYSTEPIQLNTKILASTKGFLREFQKVEMNKEIPVALMVYSSGTSMSGHSLQDYFEPSLFAGMDLVQVVTLTFTDKWPN